MATSLGSELRGLGITVAAAAGYGFCIGSAKNLTYAGYSALKVPMLLLGTALLCALASFVVARFLGVALRFVEVQRATLALYRALALLLASLSPVALFLGQTMAPPDERSLGGYPGFVGVNMLFIAAAGAMALLLQARTLLREHGVPPRLARVVVLCWLCLSLGVGGQLAFYLRPFFGIASLTGAPKFMAGDEPTVTGARNFYEVVWQFVTAADPGDYLRRR